jgi:hypothetical protein
MPSGVPISSTTGRAAHRIDHGRARWAASRRRRCPSRMNGRLGGAPAACERPSRVALKKRKKKKYKEKIRKEKKQKQRKRKKGGEKINKAEKKKTKKKKKKKKNPTQSNLHHIPPPEFCTRDE